MFKTGKVKVYTPLKKLVGQGFRLGSLVQRLKDNSAEAQAQEKPAVTTLLALALTYQH